MMQKNKKIRLGAVLWVLLFFLSLFAGVYRNDQYSGPGRRSSNSNWVGKDFASPRSWDGNKMGFRQQQQQSRDGKQYYHGHGFRGRRSVSGRKNGKWQTNSENSLDPATPVSGDSKGSFDAEARKVPTGPNPLHN